MYRFISIIIRRYYFHESKRKLTNINLVNCRIWIRNTNTDEIDRIEKFFFLYFIFCYGNEQRAIKKIYWRILSRLTNIVYMYIQLPRKKKRDMKRKTEQSVVKINIIEKESSSTFAIHMYKIEQTDFILSINYSYCSNMCKLSFTKIEISSL